MSSRWFYLPGCRLAACLSLGVLPVLGFEQASTAHATTFIGKMDVEFNTVGGPGAFLYVTAAVWLLLGVSMILQRRKKSEEEKAEGRNRSS